MRDVVDQLADGEGRPVREQPYPYPENDEDELYREGTVAGGAEAGGGLYRIVYSMAGLQGGTGEANNVKN